MKTRAIAASAIVALLLTGVVAVTFAHSAISLPSLSGIGLGNASHPNQQTHQGDNNQGNETSDNNQGNQTNTQHEDNETEDEGQANMNLTVGQVITLANLTGHSNNLTNQTSEDGRDNSRATDASGAFTFKVTAVTNGSTTLSITSGSFVINGTTYTVKNGTVTLNEGQESGSGSGTASGGASFAIRIDGLHITTNSTGVGAVKLDVQVGKSMYQVILGSHGSEDDGSETLAVRED